MAGTTGMIDEGQDCVPSWKQLLIPLCFVYSVVCADLLFTIETIDYHYLRKSKGRKYTEDCVPSRFYPE